MKRDMKAFYKQYIFNEKQFDDIVGTNDVRKGVFLGNDIYYIGHYSQPCPRGCCYDCVTEIITKREYIQEIKNEIIKMAELLKKARELEKDD